MARKNRSPEENERRAKIRELLQVSNISSMDDIQDLFKETIAEEKKIYIIAYILSALTQPRSTFQRISSASQ